jgi:CheY-like chemotaxis protein
MATIYLVEDNPSDVELFRMAIAEACVECELIVFEDGREAIDQIQQKNSEATPDLIVLDLNLPKDDGFEILEVIRTTSRLESVTVAVLSSSSSIRERAKLSTFHVRKFIAKPPDLEEYLKIGTIVRELLEEVGSQDRAATSAGG